MTFTMWLNDFHLDGLIYLRELLEGDTPRALRSAHRWSTSWIPPDKKIGSPRGP